MTIQELVTYAKKFSPFYRNLYKNVDVYDNLSIEDIPLVDQDEFWRANGLTENYLLTGSVNNGIVFKSGGTTGAPKFSVFTKQEWHDFTKSFAHGMELGGLRNGDRVANLFYAGEMYASFLFIYNSLELADIRALQFPLAGNSKPYDVLKTVRDFQINTLAGVPTSLIHIAHEYEMNSQHLDNLPITRILYGGEALYVDQLQYLQRIFPHARIASIGYASVDGGLLGYADESCRLGEHRCFGDDTILEIIDEATGKPISEPHIPGKIYITNLKRKLMPIIRYPAGDRACWSDANITQKDRKFTLLGRAEEAARIGPVTMYYEDTLQILSEFQLSRFQMLIRHRDLKDELVLRIAPHTSLETKPDLLTAFYKARPMFVDAVRKDVIHPLVIEWVNEDELTINTRTGKLKRVIDERHTN